MQITQHYRATFVPQAWIRDWAVDIDPEGETTWDVTPEFLQELVESHANWHEISMEEALKRCTAQSTSASDRLIEDPAAPEWIREHRGPFYCETELIEP